jgi:23S rRNA (cytosine1962-C5)-methyltransferase
VLNLFGYTGAASVAAAAAGATVCHVDSSKAAVQWCSENKRLSGIPQHAMRFIVDDCTKFIMREQRRGNRYDAIILDPPTFGRGPSGEIWKLEDHLEDLRALSARRAAGDRRHLQALDHAHGRPRGA